MVQLEYDVISEANAFLHYLKLSIGQCRCKDPLASLLNLYYLKRHLYIYQDEIDVEVYDQLNRFANMDAEDFKKIAEASSRLLEEKSLETSLVAANPEN